MRAADYDDWVTETTSEDGRPMHGLNGDILVWNPVTKRRHELTSMGIRVTAETLKMQLELSGQLDMLKMPYHQAIINNEIPLSIGGGIGQSPYVYAAFEKGPYRRGKCDGVAEDFEGHVQEEEYFCDRMIYLHLEPRLRTGFFNALWESEKPFINLCLGRLLIILTACFFSVAGITLLCRVFRGWFLVFGLVLPSRARLFRVPALPL
jgi:hypothetical protein